VMETQRYDKMIYTRLQVQLGMHLGYLAGDLKGKTEPFMLPFLDNLEKMESNKKGIIKNYLFAEGDESKQKVFFDSIQTMRGRSITKTYIKADKIKNTDVHTMEAIATRNNRVSKIVLLSNFAQTDEPSLRMTEKNGFNKLLKGLYAKVPGRKYFNHIHLVE